MSSIKTRSRSWRAWPIVAAAILVAAIGGANAQMGSMAPESGMV